MTDLFVYKWTVNPDRIHAYGLTPEGTLHTLTFPTADFVLLRGEAGQPLPGMTRLEGQSFIDEYGGGQTYTDLYRLETSPAINGECLREIASEPARWKYTHAFLSGLDHLHRYFILKNIPQYSGWWRLDRTASSASPPTWLPNPERKDRPVFQALFFDIECVAASQNRFPSGINANDYVSSISFIKCRLTETGNETVDSIMLLLATDWDAQSLSTSQYRVVVCPTEKDLLIRAIRIFSDPDLQFISGFNHNGFDDVFLAARYYHHQLDHRLFKWQYPRREGAPITLWYTEHQLSLDVYQFFKIYQRYEQNSLDFLARAVLKTGERKQPMNHEEMRQAFLTIDRQPLAQVRRILDYNFYDSLVTLKLFEQSKMLNFILSISSLCYLNVERVILAGKSELLFAYVAIEGFKRGYLMNRGRWEQHASGTYQGAVVYLSQPGIYDRVSVLDFRSLYPSIILAKNLSPSTCVMAKEPPRSDEDRSTYFSVCLSEDRYCWSFKPDRRVGLFPLICQRLMRFREELKSQLKTPDLSETDRQYFSFLQLAVKILSNSLYGQLGCHFSPLYCKNVAESVTAHSRAAILEAKEFFQRRQIDTLFADTDSLFIQTADEPTGRRLTQEVNAFMNTPELEMEFELFYTRLFLYSKKKYFGQLSNGAYKASGFELKKRDFPQHCKGLLNQWLVWVLTQPHLLEENKIQMARDLFRYDLVFRYDLFCKTLNLKAMYKYKPSCTAPHVSYMRRLGEQTTILNGKFVHLLYSPLPDHQKKGFAMHLLHDDTTHMPQRVPVHLASCLTSACNLFDKIYHLVYPSDKPVAFFKAYRETMVKYNLVIFELKATMASIIVTFSKPFSIKTLPKPRKRKRKQPSIRTYLKELKR